MNDSFIPRRFEGRSVLVTGAAGGIGFAAATAFAREGANLTLADRNAEALRDVAERLEPIGTGVATSVVDVTDPDSVASMVATAVDAHGGLHVAFNNAGVPSSSYSRFSEIDPRAWRQVIDVNLSGVFYCMHAEVPALVASGGGTIVNTASIASFAASPGMAPYVSSKHGVGGLTKAAAIDLISSGVRVNAVCPGFVDTPMLAPLIADPHERSALESKAPIGRVASPDEIAAAVLFLASDASSYMVGSLVSVDGGLAAV